MKTLLTSALIALATVTTVAPMAEAKPKYDKKSIRICNDSGWHLNDTYLKRRDWVSVDAYDSFTTSKRLRDGWCRTYRNIGSTNWFFFYNNRKRIAIEVEPEKKEYIIRESKYSDKLEMYHYDF